MNECDFITPGMLSHPCCYLIWMRTEYNHSHLKQTLWAGEPTHYQQAALCVVECPSISCIGNILGDWDTRLAKRCLLSLKSAERNVQMEWHQKPQSYALDMSLVGRTIKRVLDSAERIFPLRITLGDDTKIALRSWLPNGMITEKNKRPGEDLETHTLKSSILRHVVIVIFYYEVLLD